MIALRTTPDRTRARCFSVAALLFFSLVSASMSFGAQPPQHNHNPNGDKEVPNAATDGISCVAWSPAANYVAAGSWDNQVRDLFLSRAP